MLFKTIALLFAASAALATGTNGCTHNNCDRAVIADSRPSVQPQHKADCAAAFQCTVTPAPTTTVTVTVKGTACTESLQTAIATPSSLFCPPPPAQINSDEDVKKMCKNVPDYRDACVQCGIIDPTTTVSPPAATATLFTKADGQTPCSGTCTNTLSDPSNCGACGTVCLSGLCENGACTNPSCTGSTCQNVNRCGPGGNCACASTTAGIGFCVDGSTSCGALKVCGANSDCNLGEVCAVKTCCPQGNVCIGASTCGGSVQRRAARREWVNGTIANPNVRIYG